MEMKRASLNQRVLCLSALAVAALGLAALREGDPLLYNHSPSLPVGFYMRTDSPIERGAIVTVRAADVAGEYAALRAFDGPDDRFIKRVAAMQGDVVCAENDTITINARTVAHRAAIDSAGRALPRWNGCIELGGDELFLLGDTSDSFDGRYFGIVRRSDIEGVWRRVL